MRRGSINFVISQKNKFKNHETNFSAARITNQRLKRSSKQTERGSTDEKVNSEEIMDAKWNNVMDNALVRVTLVIVGFGAWLAISYGLLSL